MIAIETKYLGPTNYRGARIVATTANGQRHTVSYSYELSGEDVHRVAAEELARKMGWLDKYRLIGGGTKAGYVFVFVPEDDFATEYELDRRADGDD